MGLLLPLIFLLQKCSWRHLFYLRWAHVYSVILTSAQWNDLYTVYSSMKSWEPRVQYEIWSACHTAESGRNSLEYFHQYPAKTRNKLFLFTIWLCFDLPLRREFDGGSASPYWSKRWHGFLAARSCKSVRFMVSVNVDLYGLWVNADSSCRHG